MSFNPQTTNKAEMASRGSVLRLFFECWLYERWCAKEWRLRTYRKTRVVQLAQRLVLSHLYKPVPPARCLVGLGKVHVLTRCFNNQGCTYKRKFSLLLCFCQIPSPERSWEMSEHRQDFPDPNYNSPSMHEVSHPRRNGCSCPWHPFQLIAWFFILLFTVAHFGFLAFYVPGLWRIAIYAVSFLRTHVCINH